MNYYIYKLQPHEFYRYREHLLALDRESRYYRFGFNASPEVITQLCREWERDCDNHEIFVIENDNMEIAGVAHVSLTETKPELAFSVLREYQRCGMGDALLKRAVEYCQNRGLREGYMVCLASNSPIKSLARKNNILVHSEDGESYGDVAIPQATALSVWSEYVKDVTGNLDHAGRATRKRAQQFWLPVAFLR